MGDLGSFGVSKALTGDETFVFIGERFRVNPNNSELDELDWLIDAAEVPAEGPGQDTVAVFRALRDRIKRTVHEDDAERFWQHCKKHRQTQDDIKTLIKGLTAAMAGVPTQQQSGSPAGLLPTDPESTNAPESEVGAALRELEGRPDKQLMVVDAVSAQDRQSQSPMS
jgi:hypothetical protein